MENLDGLVAVGVSLLDREAHDVDGGQNVVAVDVDGADAARGFGTRAGPILDLPRPGTAAGHGLILAERLGTPGPALRNA
jgi:hypothetical protein